MLETGAGMDCRKTRRKLLTADDRLLFKIWLTKWRNTHYCAEFPKASSELYDDVAISSAFPRDLEHYWYNRLFKCRCERGAMGTKHGAHGCHEAPRGGSWCHHTQGTCDFHCSTVRNCGTPETLYSEICNSNSVLAVHRFWIVDLESWVRWKHAWAT